MNFNIPKFFNTGFEKKDNSKEENKTPSQLKIFGEKMTDIFCKTFSVKGKENITKIKESDPDEKFIISASHLHNLDVPAALRALGDDFNIQITGESVLLEKMKYIFHKMMISLGGKSNFTALDYKEDSEGKRGSFNPDNFADIEQKMNEGKTPWIAAHPFSLDEKMKKISIGPVYLASKTGASIIPTALEIIGSGSMNLEGNIERIKALKNRGDGIYHIGAPLKLPKIDISIIDNVLDKKSRNEKITEEELAQFTSVHRQLKDQADILANAISSLLPEEKRGYYASKNNI